MAPARKSLFLASLLVLSLAAVVHADDKDNKSERERRTDRHGDPLPQGAVARLGSIQWYLGDRGGPLAFAPDGKTMAMTRGGVGPSTLYVWDTTTGKMVRRLPLPLSGANGLIFTPDGRYLVIPDALTVHLIDAATGKSVRHFDSGEQMLGRVALSPDGKLLAIGCRSRWLRKPSHILLWDVATGKEKGQLTGHDTGVESVAFSADGKRLLSASEDYEGTPGTLAPRLIRGSICIWDMPGGKLRQRSPARGGQNVFSPDGHTVAYMSGKEWQVHLWDLEAKKEPVALPLNNAGYLFLPDGKTLAASGREQPPGLWDAATGKKVRSFHGYFGKETWIYAVAPDGKRLATVGEGSLRLWDMATGNEQRLFAGHHDTVSCVAFSRDGKTVVSGSKDRTLRVWDAGTGRERLVYRGHEAGITAVTLSPDGKLVASGDAHNHVQVWERATGKCLHTLDAHPERRTAEGDGVTFVTFSPDGKKLVGGSRIFHVEAGVTVSGVVSTWDPISGKLLRSSRQEDGYPTAVAPDGTLVAAIVLLDKNLLGVQLKLVVHRIDTGKEVFQIEGDPAELLEPVAFSNDGKLLAVMTVLHRIGFPVGGGAPEPRPRLYELASGKKILDLKQRGSTLAFAPDDRTLTVGGPLGENRVFLLSTATGRIAQKLNGHLGSVACLAFSRDGRFLASGSSDHTVLIWDRTQTPASAKGTSLDAKELAEQWTLLADDDAPRAYRAVWALVDEPRAAIDLLREHLRPVPTVTSERIDSLIRDLDSDQFSVRQKALTELETLGPLAAPALRKVLAGQPTAEQRQKVKRLLTRIERSATETEGLRITRAIAVLEHIGTADARRLLRRLADGAAGARLTEEARAALQRLE